MADIQRVGALAADSALARASSASVDTLALSHTRKSWPFGRSSNSLRNSPVPTRQTSSLKEHRKRKFSMKYIGLLGQIHRGRSAHGTEKSVERLSQLQRMQMERVEYREAIALSIMLLVLTSGVILTIATADHIQGPPFFLIGALWFTSLLFRVVVDVDLDAFFGKRVLLGLGYHTLNLAVAVVATAIDVAAWPAILVNLLGVLGSVKIMLMVPSEIWLCNSGRLSDIMPKMWLRHTDVALGSTISITFGAAMAQLRMYFQFKRFAGFGECDEGFWGIHEALCDEAGLEAAIVTILVGAIMVVIVLVDVDKPAVSRTMSLKKVILCLVFGVGAVLLVYAILSDRFVNRSVRIVSGVIGGLIVIGQPMSFYFRHNAWGYGTARLKRQSRLATAREVCRLYAPGDATADRSAAAKAAIRAATENFCVSVLSMTPGASLQQHRKASSGSGDIFIVGSQRDLMRSGGLEKIVRNRQRNGTLVRGAMGRTIERIRFFIPPSLTDEAAVTELMWLPPCAAACSSSLVLLSPQTLEDPYAILQLFAALAVHSTDEVDVDVAGGYLSIFSSDIIKDIERFNVSKFTSTTSSEWSPSFGASYDSAFSMLRRVVDLYGINEFNLDIKQFISSVVRRRKIAREATAGFNFEQMFEILINHNLLSTDGNGDGPAPRKPDELDRSSISIQERLGEGEFGIVYKGCYERRASSGSNETVEVALKMLKRNASSTEMEDLLAEGMVAAAFDHPNILALIGVVTVGAPVMLVLEYCMGGTLLSRFRNLDSDKVAREPRFFVSWALREAAGIAEGMTYLAARRFVHRDLALRNVLAAAEGIPKLSDFGMSRKWTSKNQEYYRASDITAKVPLRWCSVEVLSAQMFSEKSDVWSFGICCIEMFTFGDLPFSHLSNEQVVDSVKSGAIGQMPRPPLCPIPIYSDLVRPCLAFMPQQRPRFSELRGLLAACLADFPSPPAQYYVTMQCGQSSGDLTPEPGTPTEKTFTASFYSAATKSQNTSPERPQREETALYSGAPRADFVADHQLNGQRTNAFNLYPAMNSREEPAEAAPTAAYTPLAVRNSTTV